MGSELSNVVHLSNLSAISNADVEANDVTPRADPGAIIFKHSRGYGMQLLKYCRNHNGSAVARGECMSFVADTSANVDRSTSAGTITSASTTTSVVGSGLTADAHNGALLYITNDAGVAGGAPEGESAVIAKNTTTVITLDPDTPLTAAPTTSDTAEIISTFQFEDGVDDDLAWCVMGCVMAAGGIDNLSHGWLGIEGLFPLLYSAATIAVGAPIVAGAAIFAAFGSDGYEKQVGFSPELFTSDVVNLRGLGYLKLFSPNTSATVP